MCATQQKKEAKLLPWETDQRCKGQESADPPVEPVFVHVVSGCQGTVQPLEQLSQAAGGPGERQPVRWQLEELWHIRQNDSGYRDGRGGKKQKDISSKPHWVLTDIPLLPFPLLSSPLCTSFKHRWHVFAPMPALAGNRHSHAQRRSPSRCAAAVAAIPVHWWLSVCACMCVLGKRGEGGLVGGYVGGWIC